MSSKLDRTSMHQAGFFSGNVARLSGLTYLCCLEEGALVLVVDGELDTLGVVKSCDWGQKVSGVCQTVRSYRAERWDLKVAVEDFADVAPAR